MHNPWAQPPSSKDWDVQPTYPRHDPMPYYLAPLWDVHYSHVVDHQSAARAAERANEKHQIPKVLRLKLKHARAAHGMLRDLEEEVRTFIQKWNERELLLEKEGLRDAPEYSTSDDSEDEIVFVGRNGQMHDSPERKERLRLLREEISSHSERDGEKMVLETLADDRAAGFGYVLSLPSTLFQSADSSQSLVSPLHRILLWIAHLVHHSRRPTRSLCGLPIPGSGKPRRARFPPSLPFRGPDQARRGAPSASLCSSVNFRLLALSLLSSRLDIFIGE